MEHRKLKHSTYQTAEVLYSREDVDLTLLGRQSPDVDQRRRHGTVVGFLFFCLVLRHLCRNNAARLATLGGLRHAGEQLLLRLQSLVSLPLAELLQTISNDNFMQSPQFRLHHTFSTCGEREIQDD